MLLPEPLPALHLKCNHFVSLNMVNDLSLYSGFYIAACRQFAIQVGQQHITEINFITSITSYAGYIQCLVFLDPELLTGYFYNCEHNFEN